MALHPADMEKLSEDKPRGSKKSVKVENVVQPLLLTGEDYRKIMGLMDDNLNQGLGAKTNEAAKVKMFPTYVRTVPDGTENGDFLALDLGGTNFRVLLVSLNGQEVTMDSKIYLIPQAIMLGTGVQLFDHIVDCIYKFMKAHNLLGKKQVPLGFTFSFPCKQNGLAEAYLTRWTKGFKCEGVVGNNIVRLLHEAIERKGEIDVECLAVINDTVGALMSCAHSNQECGIGLILGTGTNACYMERLDKVGLWNEELTEPLQVIINTEWGAFGDDGCLDFIRTDQDKNVDKHSINEGEHIFEKMISGMYMGEIVRLVLLKLIKNKLLFNGTGSELLSTRGRFFTKYVSEVESDEDDDFKNTKQVFDDLQLERSTVEDCRLVQYVCSLVSKRAAYLAGAGVAALINRIDKPCVTVGVDGSLYRFHPRFKSLMEEKIQDLITPGRKFELMLSSDGSGKGAALVAAVAHRLKYQDKQQTPA